MTKPVIRPAGDKDTKAIKQLQANHVKDLDFDVYFPEDAYWLVADWGNGPYSACGLIDRPEECQIMLLWEQGKQNYVAAAALMDYVIEDAKDKTLWFVAQTDVPERVVKMYNKWGFFKRGGNAQISVYARGK